MARGSAMSVSRSTSCLALLINHMLFYVNACQTLINTEKKNGEIFYAVNYSKTQREIHHSRRTVQFSEIPN